MAIRAPVGANKCEINKCKIDLVEFYKYEIFEKLCAGHEEDWYYWLMHDNAYQETHHKTHWALEISGNRCQAPPTDQWQLKLPAADQWKSRMMGDCGSRLHGKYPWVFTQALNNPGSTIGRPEHNPDCYWLVLGGLATMRDWTLQCTPVGENKAAYLWSENRY